MSFVLVRGRGPGNGCSYLDQESAADRLATEPMICSSAGTKSPGGQPGQVQQRQYLSDLRRLPGPCRQDRRSTPAPFSRHLIDACVVDPRLTNLDRARRRRDLPRLVVTVAGQQPVAVFVDLTRMGVDVGGDLRLQRRREHRAADRGRGGNGWTATLGELP